MNTVAVVCAGVVLLMCFYLLWFWFCFGNYVKRRQKTRNPPPRRVHGGPRPPRPSLGQQEPTIYVSPSNLPPPPKYECMAPPSYEEVVGVHYPQLSAQPITQPISNALAQGPAQPDVANATSITVINEPQRTSVTVART